jgi:hypothetical protein
LRKDRIESTSLLSSGSEARNLRWMRIGVALACAGLVGGLSASSAAGDAFRLVVTGSTFVDFEGECRLVDKRGFEAWSRLVGSVPQGYAIRAEAVSCEVRNADLTGTLTARLEQDGVMIARASTRASRGKVSVRSDGPWGPARATVRVFPLLPRQHLPPSHQPLQPPSHQPGLPLNPPIVPPLRGQSVPPLR